MSDINKIKWPTKANANKPIPSTTEDRNFFDEALRLGDNLIEMPGETPYIELLKEIERDYQIGLEKLQLDREQKIKNALESFFQPKQ